MTHNWVVAESSTQFAAAGVQWDLSPLFSSNDDPLIERLWAEVNDRADRFAESYRGKIEDGELSAQELVAAIAEYESIIQEAGKPGNYASLWHSADVGDPVRGAFYQDQAERGSELTIKIMFFTLELQAAPDEYIDGVLADDSSANYRHFIRNARAFSPHMLSETEEVLLEEVANTGSRAWVRLHDELTANHEMPYVDPLTGEMQMLTQSEVLAMLRNPDRSVRKAAADAVTQAMKELERAITFTYNTLLADKRLEDRLRKFEYPEQSRHLANELEKETVDVVVELCSTRADSVERYYNLKRQILNVDELAHYDRYAPIFDTAAKVGWKDATSTVLDSFGEFSPTMREHAAAFFDRNWIDAEPRKGKTGGAFCSYVTPDLNPYVLMSYHGNISDVMTLAHELGHGVHASLSREQTYLNFHGTLPLAELASIFGEMLVFESVTADASDETKLALYADKIEGIFASVFRQAFMFRFERRCHVERRESGELSPERFRELWLEEQQLMFGESIPMTEDYGWWWIYIGHFFFAPFYVYAYAFGELLTLGLYKTAKEQGAEFEQKYIEVLRLGGSKTPHELMEIVGVDLRSRDFWNGAFDVIDELVSTFEQLNQKVNKVNV